MNIRILPVALASIALLGVSAPAFAGKGKGKKGAGNPARVLAHFDKDHNGVIDGKEATKAQAVYAALYALDTNHDGQLSESELAAAKIPTGDAAKGGKKKKNK
jgi:hypothetical protein